MMMITHKIHEKTNQNVTLVQNYFIHCKKTYFVVKKKIQLDTVPIVPEYSI